ncbi:phosphoric monoester hydrolase [bacterium]|nr:MAG: phosphoric monoester hydrolase [bacterium]
MPKPSSLFDLHPLVITALHLPELGMGHKPMSMSWLEDYTLKNLAVFVEGGVPAVILQEETLNPNHARPENIAVMASLARIARHEFPALQLGIILQAHDPQAPLAIAHASGASFVRIKVFVGAILKAEGIQQGCAVVARDYRAMLGREDIQILADVHDRTGYPVSGEPIEVAADWAAHSGADGLILTGFTYEESLQYIDTVHKAGIQKPLLLGGGADESNVAEVLEHADGVIVSSALKRKDISPDEMVLWDVDSVKRFMEAAHAKNQLPHTSDAERAR